MGAFLMNLLSKTLLMLLPDLIKRIFSYLARRMYNKKLSEKEKQEAKIKVEAYEKAPAETAHDDFKKLP